MKGIIIIWFIMIFAVCVMAGIFVDRGSYGAAAMLALCVLTSAVSFAAVLVAHMDKRS